MSKSSNNHIEIISSPKEILQRVMTAVTDPARRYRSDTGHPDRCNVYSLHKVFSNSNTIEEISSDCRNARIGCVDCKKLLAKNISDEFAPFREKRSLLVSKPEYVREVLADGAKRAEAIAIRTMDEVRESMKLFRRDIA